MFGNKRDDLDYLGFYTKTNDVHTNKNESRIVPNFIWTIVGILFIIFIIRELFVMFTVGVFVNEASKMNTQITKATDQFQKEIVEGSKQANESMQRLRTFNPPQPVQQAPQQIIIQQVPPKTIIEPKAEKKESNIKIEMH